MGQLLDINKETIDRVLGSASYEKYQLIMDAYLTEQDRAWQNLEYYSGFFSTALARQLEADLELVEIMGEDLYVFLIQAQSGKLVTRTQYKNILAAMSLAVEILHTVNNVLEEMHKAGITVLFVAVHQAKLEVEAKEAMKAMEKFKKELDKAKSEFYSAGYQVAFNVVATVISNTIAPTGLMSILARGGIALVQMSADNNLGTNTSTEVTWGSRGATSAGAVVSSAEDFMTEANKVRQATGPAGKMLTIMGFGFDLYEVHLAYSRKEELQKVSEEAATKVTDLEAKIVKYKETIDTLKKRLAELKSNMKTKGQTELHVLRSALAQELQRSGYKPKGYVKKP